MTPTAYYYPVQDFRNSLINSMRGHGSVEGVCIHLGISVDMFYKIKKGSRNPPGNVLDKLGVYKVCDRLNIVGYCKLDSDIDWEVLWKE